MSGLLPSGVRVHLKPIGKHWIAGITDAPPFEPPDFSSNEQPPWPIKYRNSHCVAETALAAIIGALAAFPEKTP